MEFIIDKLIVTHLTFCGIPMFVIVFTKASHRKKMAETVTYVAGSNIESLPGLCLS